MRTVEFDEEKDAVVIDGIAIAGFIDSRPCNTCGALLVYFDTYDASFCPHCNVWKEGRCLDPSCSYCRHRPKRPLDNDVYLPLQPTGAAKEMDAPAGERGR